MVDVVLVGEEAVLEIPAHKLLLAACSPYFNSRLVDIFATFNHIVSSVLFYDLIWTLGSVPPGKERGIAGTMREGSECRLQADYSF